MTTPDHDPFRGVEYRGAAAAPEFPEDRLRAAGVSDADVEAVRGHYADAAPEDQAGWTASMRQVDDETVRASVAAVLRTDYSTADRTVEDVKADVEGDPELLDVALASERGGKARKTLIAHLEELVQHRDTAHRGPISSEATPVEEAPLTNPDLITPATDAGDGSEVNDVQPAGQPATDAGTGEQVQDVPPAQE